MFPIRTARTLLLLAVLGACRTDEPSRQPGAAARLVLAGEDQGVELAPCPRKGSRPAPKWAQRPRFAPPPEQQQGLRCLPDGDLAGWEGRDDVHWDRRPTRIGQGDDLGGRIAIASYPRGLSFAAQVRDSDHRAAAHESAFGDSDHVELRLWPIGGGPLDKQVPPDSAAAAAIGVRLRLGTNRQLIQWVRPADTWRADIVSSAGVDVPGGYRVEARLPLSVLTPLTSPRVTAVRYEVVIHDGGRPALTFAGTFKLAVAMELPEAAQKRASLRVCVAGEPDALWGYRNGWRCTVPHYVGRVLDDDGQARAEQPARANSVLRFGHHRVPEPPVLQWLRERMVFINLVGVNRGIAALIDRRDNILSLLRIGVAGGRDPGNPRARDADALPLKLPDGTWAVILTYAYDSPVGVAGGRCAAGHRVYASIVAARGAPESTPHDPAPEPDTPPQLEEGVRTLIEDCTNARAHEWSLSKDRRVIQVRDLVHPSRGVRTYVFSDGWYQEEQGD